jgi:alpha-tubulin suppressor-like RCC1 family protein
VNTSDQAYCFGQNNRGQLGDGTTSSNHLPQLFLTNVKKISVGYEFICALTNTDEVYCAGQNSFNRLPIAGASLNQDFNTPTKINLSVTPKDIFASRESLCVTYGVDDQAICFGESRYGQFGNEFGTLQTSPAEVTSLSGVVDVSAGYDFGCSVKDSKVSCYGMPYYYRTGNNVFLNFDYNYHTPAEITSAVANAVDVEAGRYHSCARDSVGDVYCWGLRALMGSGGGSGAVNTPTKVTGITNVDFISLAALSSCALDQGGNVTCWGLGSYGQLGQGATDETNQGTPVAVTLPAGVSKLSSKHNNHCALVSGSVYCWGANHYNQLGDSADITADFYGSPNQVALEGAVSDIAVGYHHACAVVSGEVFCWGNANFGQLGSAQSLGNHDATKVEGLSNIMKIWAGYRHNCAINTSNDLFCWGDNLMGQIGNSEFGEPVRTPVEVSVSGVTSMSLGRSQTCAIASGKQYCWGDHSDGQLGLGDRQWYTPSTGASVMYNADFDEFPK